MEQGFQFADELGPVKVIHIHEPLLAEIQARLDGYWAQAGTKG